MGFVESVSAGNTQELICTDQRSFNRAVRDPKMGPIYRPASPVVVCVISQLVPARVPSNGSHLTQAVNAHGGRVCIHTALKLGPRGWSRRANDILINSSLRASAMGLRPAATE